MLSTDEFSKLLADVGQMSREIAEIAKSDPDPKRRAQAQRWRNTILRETDCIAELTGLERKRGNCGSTR
jgi:hypothetical protein